MNNINKCYNYNYIDSNGNGRGGLAHALQASAERWPVARGYDTPSPPIKSCPIQSP